MSERTLVERVRVRAREAKLVAMESLRCGGLHPIGVSAYKRDIVECEAVEALCDEHEKLQKEVATLRREHGEMRTALLDLGILHQDGAIPDRSGEVKP